MPGYSAVDEALERLQESGRKGFAVGKFNGEDRDRASHLMAHIIATKVYAVSCSQSLGGQVISKGGLPIRK